MKLTENEIASCDKILSEFENNRRETNITESTQRQYELRSAIDNLKEHLGYIEEQQDKIIQSLEREMNQTKNTEKLLDKLTEK